jgi:hypothetical protein
MLRLGVVVEESAQAISPLGGFGARSRTVVDRVGRLKSV